MADEAVRPSGGGGIFLALALVAALALVGLEVRLGHTYPLREFDTEQRAGSARALLETGKWSALTLRHWELVGHEQTARDRPWPVQVWSLGYPLLLAAGFALVHNQDAVAVGLPVLAYLACFVLTFLLARRLGGVKVAGLALVLLLAHAGLAQRSAVSHLESTYAVFLLGATLLFIARPGRWGVALLGGALLGFAYTIRPTALAWFPLVLLAGVGEEPDRRRGGIFAAVLGLALMLAANTLLVKALSPPALPVTGPTISYGQMQLREATPLSISTADHAVPQSLSRDELLTRWPEFAQKLTRGAGEALLNVGYVFPVGLLLLAVMGMLAAVKRPEARVLAGVALVAAGLGALGVLLTAYFSMDRYFADWAPFLAVFGALGLGWAYEQASSAGRTLAPAALVLVALVLVGGPFLTALLPLRSLSRLPEGYFLGREVERLVPTGAIVGSPAAAEIAWHGHRRAIVLPLLSPDQVLEVDRRLQRMDALVLEKGQFPGGTPPETLGDFRKVGEAVTAWRVVKGQRDMHTWEVYVRARVRSGT